MTKECPLTNFSFLNPVKHKTRFNIHVQYNGRNVKGRGFKGTKDENLIKIIFEILWN